MENHQPHFHSHHQQPQYEFLMPDLRQLMTANRPTSHYHFPAAAGILQPEVGAAGLFPGHHRSSLTPQQAGQQQQQQNFEMLMLPRGLQDLGGAAANCNDGNKSTSSITVTAGVSTPGFSNTGFEGEVAGAGAYLGGWEGGNGRWPRQETLTLLEIRSRLDSKFKEANQKGPLWDEISRVMCEEHGYQRSGKKCREKFENLYKYYKKTKEGKAGRHDGKHYRFFRQLEALYGDLHTPNNKTPLSGISSGTTLHFNPSTTTSQFHEEINHISLTPSNHNSYSESDEVSSATDDDDNELNTVEITYSAERVKKTRKKKKKKRGSSWKEKIKEFIDSQMRKLVEKQETWLEKLTRTLEQKEKERAMREEEWKRQDQGRVDRENKFWGKQRAWIEARDAALMETLQTFTGINKHLKAPAAAQAADVDDDGIINGETISNNNTNDRWTDGEITKLIQMRTNMEARFQQCSTDDDDSEELALWEEVASRMIGKGFEKKNALMCKDKWDCIKSYRKLSKENVNNNSGSNYNSRSSSNCGYMQSGESSFYSQGTAYETTASGRQLLQLNHQHNIYCSSSTVAGETSNSNNDISNAASLSDSCFRFLIADNGDHHLWENYGLKLSNVGSDHHQCSDTLHL